MSTENKPGLWQRALSYVWPQRIRSFNHQGHQLTLEMYRGEWMLCTPEAIYSWGTRYRPFRIPFKHLKKELPHIKRFLLLGTGLGSALQILQQKHHCYPEAVLVDHNALTLHLSEDFMQLNSHNNVQWVCNDALQVLNSPIPPFDLIGIDLFTDMQVEHQFKQEAFYRLIATKMNPGGIAIFNNVFHSQNDRDIVLKRMNMVFNHVHPITKGINTFTIARITK